MNYDIITNPTGRSPEHKLYFGARTAELDTTRPQYCKIGGGEQYHELDKLMTYNSAGYTHQLEFVSSGIKFRVLTDSDVHAQFVSNMFSLEHHSHLPDWTIIHSVHVDVPHPRIYVHLDRREMLIAGTTYLGEIKKGVFGIVNFELPTQGKLPMHCSAFTYNNTTNLMFGLSGTGKTTLSSDPEFCLIGDDETYWDDSGIYPIEAGCYAKSDGLSPDTHPTIFNAVERARARGTLVVENPHAANARLSYPISTVSNAYHVERVHPHPTNIFFLTMDAEGILPSLSRIEGETIRLFFETGYTSLMPGTEAGSDSVKAVFSPCYGSPFMPRRVCEYSDSLMNRIAQHNPHVWLLNTGLNKYRKRFSLQETRQRLKSAILGTVHTNALQIGDYTIAVDSTDSPDISRLHNLFTKIASQR
jgi:phosphoenolpyruvate carboxykinase (ATP)